MIFKLCLLGILIQILDLLICDDEYVYRDLDPSELTKTKDDGGSRLVGARAAKHSTEAPFLVALNPFSSTQLRTSCTGSLLTPWFILSAAHCSEYIPQDGIRKGIQNVDEVNQECVRVTRERGQYRTLKGTIIKCKFITFRDPQMGKTLSNLEITLVSPKGRAWIGVNDLTKHDFDTEGDVQTATIKRAIRHADSYQGGGGYGTFGGYDIALFEVDTSLKADQFGCLPSPTFHDTSNRGILAGYGRYLRDKGHTCETNEYGLGKHHYCKRSGWPGANPCTSSRPPEQDKICKQLFRKVDNWDEYGNFIEAMVFNKRGNKPHYCFREANPENKDYGWCYVEGKYYDLYNPDVHVQSWGYCSKDCYLDKSDGDGQVLRIIDDAHVLDESLCGQYLNWSLQSEPHVKVRPEVLCVASEYEWRVAIYRKNGQGGFDMIEDEDPSYNKLKKKHYGIKEGLNEWGYVASAGTCSGDSGGPLYVADGESSVVTGVVSGGRGDLASCGGINNPVHYVRVKKFVLWIVKVLGYGSNKICWNSDFQKKINEQIEKMKMKRRQHRRKIRRKRRQRRRWRNK